MALAERAGVVRPLLTECITRDPRFQSVEDRASYYADLALVCGLELGPLARHLCAHDGSREPRANTDLTVDTVGALAIRGDGRAVELLRDYVGWGWRWEFALDALAAAGREACDRLDGTVCVRFADDDELDVDLGEPPWCWWTETNPRLAQLADEHAAATAGAVSDYPAGLTGDVAVVLETLAGLEEWPDGITYLEVVDRLIDDVGEGALDAVARGAAAGGDQLRQICLRAPGRLGDPRLIEILEAGYKTFPRRLEFAARDAVCAAPPELVLDHARRWFTTGGFEWLGEVALEEHATDDDIPLLRWASSNAPDHHNPWRECRALRTLTRLDAGPLPEAERIFTETAYSRQRHDAAANLAVARSFDGTWAVECLWDCEPDTRQLGCERVDLSVRSAINRLRELSTARHEDPDVGLAAANRL
jgi:hypothetical protein